MSPEDNSSSSFWEPMYLVTSSAAGFLLGSYEPSALDEPSRAIAYMGVTALIAVILGSCLATEVHHRSLRALFSAIVRVERYKKTLVAREINLLDSLAGVVPRPLQHTYLRLALELSGGEKEATTASERKTKRRLQPQGQGQTFVTEHEDDDSTCNDNENGDKNALPRKNARNTSSNNYHYQCSACDGGNGSKGELVVNATTSTAFQLKFPMTRDGLVMTTTLGLRLPKTTNLKALPIHCHTRHSAIIYMRVDNYPMYATRHANRDESTATTAEARERKKRKQRHADADGRRGIPHTQSARCLLLLLEIIESSLMEVAEFY